MNSVNNIGSPTTGGLRMLREMRPNLPKSEKKIAAYILEHPEQLIDCTASQLGERSSTSSAAVIRLCKSLGLKGFQDLKIRVAGDLHKNVDEGYRDIDPNESQSSVIQKMTTNSIQTLRETIEVLNQQELSQAVEAMVAAQTVHFYGIGASAIIAKDAQQKWLRINKQATAFADLHMLATLIANAEADDVVMGISFSGETIEVANILELAKEKGLTTISLTSYGHSSVSELADITLHTSSSREAVFRSAATSSRLAQLHVIDILFMCMASSKYQESVRNLDQTREAVQFLRDKGTGKKSSRKGRNR